MNESALDITTLNSRAVRHSMEIVEGATVVDLGRPTPCAGWTLADLLGHMTAQHRGFAAAAEGDGQDLAHWEVRPAGDDEVKQYLEASERVLAAFAAPGVLDSEFTLPEFPVDPPVFPARLAIGFHFIDYVVHGWDVARTLGLPFDPDPELLEPALKVALAVPGGDSRLRVGAAFGPALDDADTDADDAIGTMDRILLLLGRSPKWPEA
jgi:uncharacterized protein (TIGR03086 family)